jgi:hypothetical protein
MTLDRALEINSLVFNQAVDIHVEGHIGKLPDDLTLEQLAVATRIVSENRRTENPDGTFNTTCTVDPRMIALMYAFQHFGMNAVEMLAALGIKFDEEFIDFCAGCWTFTRLDDVRHVNGHLYCPECREQLRSMIEDEIETATTN